MLVTAVICLSVFCVSLIIMCVALYRYYESMNALLCSVNQSTQNELDSALDELNVINDICAATETKLNNLEKKLVSIGELNDMTTVSIKFTNKERRDSFIDYMNNTSFINEWSRVYKYDDIKNIDLTDLSLEAQVKICVPPPKQK